MPLPSSSFRLYALGSNGAGQLGLGHFEDTSKPEECLFVASNDGDGESNGENASVPKRRVNGRVKQIVAGGNHTILLMEAGDVFAVGNSDDGRCGKIRPRALNAHFRRVEVEVELDEEILAGKVTHIAAAWEASFFVINNRWVVGCGSGSKGELGLGVGVSQATSMRCVSDVENLAGPGSSVQDITASMAHVVMVTSQGKAYGWGASRKGQLGDDLKTEKAIWEPRRLQISFPVHRILTGRDYTFLIGENEEQILLGDEKHFPARLALEAGLHSEILFSGWSNIYALHCGRLKAFGRNDRGQHPPHDIPDLCHVAAGSEHCVASTSDGAVLAWGWGEHGNCGAPIDERGNVVDRVNRLSVKSDESDTIALVAAGCATSFVVVASKT